MTFKLALIGEEKRLRPTAEALGAVAQVQVNGALDADVFVVLALSPEKGDLKKTFKPLRKAVGQECRPVAMLLCDVAEDWDDAMFEMLDSDLRGMLLCVFPEARAEAMPMLHTGQPDWQERLCELVAQNPAPVVVDAPTKRLLKFHGLQ